MTAHIRKVGYGSMGFRYTPGPLVAAQGLAAAYYQVDADGIDVPDDVGKYVAATYPTQMVVEMLPNEGVSGLVPPFDPFPADDALRARDIPQEPESQEDEASDLYYCSTCESRHYRNSQTGQDHLEHEVESLTNE